MKNSIVFQFIPYKQSSKAKRLKELRLCFNYQDKSHLTFPMGVIILEVI